jgi:hypothetical protein
MALVSGEGLEHSRRWYVGRGPMNKALTQFLTEHNQLPIHELLVANKSLFGVLKRRHGSSVAFLVTAGMENWLAMNRPVRQSHFTVQAERASSVIDNSLIFGLSERMSPLGKPEKPVETADLEFLAAKLKLHNVEEVAVGLLHSAKNPEHEKIVGQFLRDQGFKVHLSSDLTQHENEVARWWAAITNAYLGQRHRETLTELKTALQESGHLTAEVKYLGGEGLISPEDASAPLGALFGPMFALHKWRQSRNTQALLYLGVEDFWLFDGRWPERQQWRADYGAVGVKYPAHVRVDLQATQLVHKSFWGIVALSRHEGGFEPGPMCLGKGLVPQYLDVLWLLDRIGEVPGLSERLAEKARGRIEEALTALAREGGVRRPTAPKELAAMLEAEGARRLASQVPAVASEITICGPLAEALRPSLERPLKDVGVRADWDVDSGIMVRALAQFADAKSEGEN